MDALNILKLGVGGVLGTIILVLWLFGGILGAIIGIAKEEALYAVASLLVPGFGAIYTVISALGAIF
ncbi:MAG: hypothetical protein K9G62_00890 [Alphaproteobacteria bacterium]|nr:hypothetical protein [Alphaproteobacteria bacterium]